MIVVPSFAVGQQREQPIITAVFACFVVPIAPHMCGAVNTPRHVPSKNGAHHDAPEEPHRSDS